MHWSIRAMAATPDAHEEQFSLEAQQPIDDSERTLYLLRRRER